MAREREQWRIGRVYVVKLNERTAQTDESMGQGGSEPVKMKVVAN